MTSRKLRKIIQLDRQGTEMDWFNSVPEASRNTGIPEASIHEALYGSRKKHDAGGFFFVMARKKDSKVIFDE